MNRRAVSLSIVALAISITVTLHSVAIAQIQEPVELPFILAQKPVKLSFGSEQARVKIRVTWEGDKPYKIFFESEVGNTDLTPVARHPLYEGYVTPGRESKKLVIQYDGGQQTLPLNLNVKSSKPDINLTIRRSKVISCHTDQINEVEKEADTINMALFRLIKANQLLAIPPNDDCRSAGKVPRVTKAQQSRSYNLARVSKGLFSTDPLIYHAFVEAARDKQRAVSIAEIYSSEEAGLVAKSMFEARRKALDKGEFDKALAYNAELIGNAKDNSLFAKGLERQKISAQLLRTETHAIHRLARKEQSSMSANEQ